MNQTTFEEFATLFASHKAVPVIRREALASHSPLSLFRDICSELPGAFLLESAAGGVFSRYSFVGVNTRGFLSKQANGAATWVGEGSALPDGSSELPIGALDALELIVESWSSDPIPGLPPLTNGLVGMLGWDVIREIEKLPNRKAPSYSSPEVFFSMFTDLLIIDHEDEALLLVHNVFKEESTGVEAAYNGAIASLDLLQASVNESHGNAPVISPGSNPLQFEANQSQDEFIERVESAKNYVRIGDVFQVVLSQRFDAQNAASPIEVYSALRALNPSPYMYLLNGVDADGSFAVVGASPEALVTLTGTQAIMHPIAGSRPRGTTTELDETLAGELTLDAKERAEHLMLVDLARNDLLKVCESTSVRVTEFMQIHKFSHIMHLVSTVEGTIRADQNSVDVFKATFPAGTLSGAPKPRALEIIDEIEPSNRGLFGGVVGYFDFSGNADLAIAIRTAVLRDGKAHVQAGAGIVLDSVPVSEYEETKSKAAATLRAIASANLK